MRAKHLYAALAAAGLIVPYTFFVRFLAAHGPDGRELLRELFGTPISAFFAADLLISAVVFLVFLAREAARRAVPRRWIYGLALLTVGLSLAFPLFLWARESALERMPRSG